MGMDQEIVDSTNRIGLRAGPFAVRLERTLRVPDDGKVYPLPPTLGSFPLFRSSSYSAALAEGWEEPFFVPLRQSEALWLSFATSQYRAVQVACGAIDAVSGGRFPAPLRTDPQNYVVCPDQPWLDGFKTADGIVRQFVAAPLGSGLTVSEQLEGVASSALTIRVIQPKPGALPEPPEMMFDEMDLMSYGSTPDLGLGAGGAIRQQVYPDRWGVEVWDPDSFTDVRLRILNSDRFREITGLNPPQEAISAADYSRFGFPWFDLNDESAKDIAASERMGGVKGLGLKDESANPSLIQKLRRGLKPKQK